jgi:endonuclease III
MATTINKQRLITQIFSALPRGGSAHASEDDPAESRPVLEQLLYALCREGATAERADRAYRNLREHFFDWNEVRVSSTREIADTLDSLPGAEARAQRIVDFLQEVFETEFCFDLEGLHKRGLKQAAKVLSKYQAANDYVVAWVVQQSLGGHAIPLDEPSLRTLRRLGLIEGDQGDLEALRGSLEHQVPKSRGPLFNDLVSTLAEEFCLEDEPSCPSCPLVSSCLTGQDHKAGSLAGESRPHKSR